MKKLLIIVSISILAHSCATVFSGTKTKIQVNGAPADAKVYYKGNYIGESPVKVKINKKDLKKIPEIRIEKEGYIASNFQLNRQVKGSAIIGNIIFGLIGIPIDFATGAIYKPSPGKIKYKLEEN